jgi:tRNA threonylcarbamoyladenosine biosynthesis protein TsaB
MNILSIDTSTKNFSLAVAKNGKVVRYRNMILDKVLESSMIPAIEKILKDSKLKFKDLHGYAVGLGPGSFTSLRVGLSTIKAFAFATGNPVVGISSLDVMAMNVMDEKADQICTIMDARRKQVYACIFEKKDGTLHRKTDYLLTNIDDLLGLVHGATLFVGDAVPMWKDHIRAKYAEAKKKGADCRPLFADDKSAHPQAKNLSHLAFGRFEKRLYDDVETLVPIYLYTQDCQVDQSQKAR